MEQLFSNSSLKVNLLIEKIDSGELGLPELQRPFVWKDTKVRDLLDSMMRGYPLGYLMLWECPDLGKKKSIGPSGHALEFPHQVIIDGQQRLTSLYAVIKGKPVIDSSFESREIVISYCPAQDKFEVGTNSTKGSPEWIYSISDLFNARNIVSFNNKFLKDLAKHREDQGQPLTDEESDLISDRIIAVSNLRNCDFPIFDVKSSADEEDVAEIFVRVNSSGVALKQNDFILTLLSVYWDEGRKLIESFCKDSLTPQKGHATAYNLITDVAPQDIIRVVMAYAFDRARLKYGYKLLRGTDFEKKGVIDAELREQRLATLKVKLDDVLNLTTWHEFLKSLMSAGYMSNSLVLSGNAIFYTYALYLIAKHRFKVPHNANMHLTALWFFHAALTSLYTGSFESTVESHLNALKPLRSAEEYRDFIVGTVKAQLTDDYFSTTLPAAGGLEVSGKGNNAWNAYVASLNVLNARILFSKTSLPVSKLFELGSDGKRKSLEKHHLFPKAYLKSQGMSDKEINQIANYALIDWKDNMDILDESPSSYFPKICEDRDAGDIQAMELENALPPGWEQLEYDDFLRQRRKLMAAKIKEAYESLLKNAMTV